MDNCADSRESTPDEQNGTSKKASPRKRGEQAHLLSFIFPAVGIQIVK
jgi:hypothetical protein